MEVPVEKMVEWYLNICSIDEDFAKELGMRFDRIVGLRNEIENVLKAAYPDGVPLNMTKRLKTPTKGGAERPGRPRLSYSHRRESNRAGVDSGAARVSSTPETVDCSAKDYAQQKTSYFTPLPKPVKQKDIIVPRGY